MRVALTIAAIRNMMVHQLDVTTAFLNGTLEEVVYMKQPKGFEETGKEHLVCRLIKSLYGLKQAPRIWFKMFDSDLKKLGFKVVEGVECLFVCKKGRNTIYVLAYVDDFLLISNSEEEIDRIKEKLFKLYKLKDIGEVSSFLGVEIKRNYDNHSMQLNQSGYIEKILNKFGMNDCRPVKTPAVNDIYSGEDHLCDKNIPYREVVGSLLYLATRTRPDIAAAVGAVARQVENPMISHWIAVKRILRYIRGTSDYCLTLGGQKELCKTPVLEGYCDSDWGGDESDRKSVSGFIIRICDSTVAWKSIKQRNVALSTAEAEYVALSEVVKEVSWLRRILKQLGHEQACPSTIHEDNQACIDWVLGRGSGKRAKHIELKYHYSKDMSKKGEIKMKYCPSANMLADILTKPLGGNKFEELRAAIGIARLV